MVENMIGACSLFFFLRGGAFRLKICCFDIYHLFVTVACLFSYVCFYGAVTTDEFKLYFEKYGVITDAIVMTDKQTNQSRGFGFITFETAVSFTCLETSGVIHA